jgi:hypothetical protein
MWYEEKVSNFEIDSGSKIERNVVQKAFLVHTNSDSAKREKEAVTFAIRVRTMWYEEKVSNFEIDSGSKIERNVVQKGRKSVTFAWVSTYGTTMILRKRRCLQGWLMRK